VDLTGALLRAGAARPHVLAVTMPGAAAVRLAAEEQLRRRGWPAAMTPADADILLIAGNAVASLAEAAEAAWQAMPAPRARAAATHPGHVAAALDTARARLGDRAVQQVLAAGARPGPAHHGGADRHEGMDHGHGGGGMEMPGGLPLADRGDDRDGLRLDQLHVPLGPVLPDWPAGLVLRLTLQGDVVQHAGAEVLGGDGCSFWDEPWRRAAAGEHVTTAEASRRGAAAHLDSLGRFLAVAGWDAAALAARRLRDDVLAGAPSGRLRRDAGRFARRVARSRVLAWLTGGLGVLTAAEAAAAGVTGPALRAGGDVTARYRRWCAALEAAVATFDDGSPLGADGPEPPRGHARDGLAPSAGLVAVLPRLLEGTELAAARLIVASLDPDLDQLPAGAETGAGHGH
jgi:hypothetical protein